jgi:hypothetical protein
VNLWHRLAKFWKRPEEEEMPYSIVLLLREPHLFTEAELQAAGERGWGRRFDGKADPMYFVVQEQDVTMLKAGTHVVQLVQAAQPYLGEPEEISRRLPRREQKRAWLEHGAWAALDLWDRKPLREEAYAVLARFALQLADANCSAVLLPKENVLMPNDGPAEEGLRRLVRKEHW